MEGHVKRGRTFSPPLTASGVLVLGDWVRDDLPDLLWPALFLAEQGSSTAGIQFVRFQKAVLDDVVDLTDQAGKVIEVDTVLTECLDGSLTGLDRLVDRVPSAQAVVLRRAEEHGLLTSRVRKALAIYPNRPAGWLTGGAVRDPDEQDAKLLADAVRQTMVDGHREAIIKCLRFWAAIQGGVFPGDRSMLDLLRDYPVDESTRSMADTMIRSAWGGRKAWESAQHPEYAESRADWSRTFWQVNSLFTGCVRARDIRAAHERVESARPDQHDGRASDDTSPLDLADVVETEQDTGWMTEQSEAAGLQPADFRDRAIRLFTSYIESIEKAPQHIYDPNPQEVHTGIVARAAREVIMALGNPDMWCSEHGSHIGRTLVEGRIVLAWMSTQDVAIYRKYKDYGAGKAKLNSLIFEEVPEQWLTNGAIEAIEEMRRLGRNDGLLDYMTVDTGGTFSGKALRAMAEQAGLLDLYRHTFQLQSGFTHSEWWALEMTCMERCHNVLHRGHLIPSLDLAFGGDAAVARSWLIALHSLIRASLHILDVEKNVVRDAFSWLVPRENFSDIPSDVPAVDPATSEDDAPADDLS